MASKVTDLDKVFTTWALDQYNKTVWWFQRRNFKDVKCEVLWDKVKIRPQIPKYNEEKESTATRVIFDAMYENITDDDQTNLFRTEKETTSTAIANLNKGFSKSVKVGIDLPLPTGRQLREPAKAVGSFGYSLHIASEEENRVEKSLKWSVDTTIQSKRRKLTVAKLEVEESQSRYSFTMDVILKGTIIVNIRDSKDNGKIIKTIQNDIATIIMDMKTERIVKTNYLSEAIIDVTSGSVKWQFAGHLELTYGISQKTKILNQPLPETLSTASTQTGESSDEDGYGISVQGSSAHAGWSPSLEVEHLYPSLYNH